MEIRDRAGIRGATSALNLGEEAQWCIFAPCYQRYKNQRDRKQQINNLNPPLRQLFFQQ
jgi:hypothetical protein